MTPGAGGVSGGRGRVSRKCLVWLMLCLGVTHLAGAQSLAFTFDDGLDPDREPRAEAWNTQILSALHGVGVSAMVFPSLKHVGGPAGRALIAAWSEAGHSVGNHTSRHRSLGSPSVTLASFEADVLAADAAFSALPGWRPMLRFPYLKEGDTAAKRDGMRQWLRSHSYRAAPVSIDTSDWAYNAAFVRLLGPADESAQSALLDAYLRHLLDRAAYYDALAQKVGSGRTTHVMLLHVSAINAVALPRIVAAFRDAGWTIVSPEQAFADPLYARAPQVLPAGESIVWSLAKEAGVAGLRYPAEDEVYERTAIEQALGRRVP